MEEIVKPSPIIGPLTFKNVEESCVKSSNQLFYPETSCECMLCENIYSLPEDQQSLLTHLYFEHRLVVADVEQIAFLKEYMDYWKPKIKKEGLPHYCSTMLMDKKPDGSFSKGEKYYLLSDVVPEDNQLRRDLQQKRLEMILNQQTIEREDKSYERECLFCRTVIKESRPNFLNHLLDKHNFYIAKSENLVFIGELIEHLANKLDSFVCIFCEKVFKDRVILKEHMRKKVHKRINPTNKVYDQYFVSNYLEMGKNWQSYLKMNQTKNKVKKAPSSTHSGRTRSCKESSEESDNDWSDWEEKDNLSITCLFCLHSESKYKDILAHMTAGHNFDFNKVTKNFNFYDKIKIVNYVRRQVHLKKCVSCDEEFDAVAKLLAHMAERQHFLVDNTSLWNQPEFFFSTYEDDGFLYSIEDNESSGEEETVEAKEDSSGVKNISEEVALSVLSD